MLTKVLIKYCTFDKVVCIAETQTGVWVSAPSRWKQIGVWVESLNCWANLALF